MQTYLSLCHYLSASVCIYALLSRPPLPSINQSMSHLLVSVHSVYIFALSLTSYPFLCSCLCLYFYHSLSRNLCRSRSITLFRVINYVILSLFYCFCSCFYFFESFWLDLYVSICSCVTACLSYSPSLNLSFILSLVLTSCLCLTS